MTAIQSRTCTQTAGAADMAITMGQPVAGAAACVRGFARALTSFVGRAGPVRHIDAMLEEYRLVTVTGPGGSGKTRLAGQVAGRFADGARLAELAPVRDPAQVAAVVAAALGIREQPGGPVPAGSADAALPR